MLSPILTHNHHHHHHHHLRKGKHHHTPMYTKLLTSTASTTLPTISTSSRQNSYSNVITQQQQQQQSKRTIHHHRHHNSCDINYNTITTTSDVNVNVNVNANVNCSNKENENQCNYNTPLQKKRTVNHFNKRIPSIVIYNNELSVQNGSKTRVFLKQKEGTIKSRNKTQIGGKLFEVRSNDDRLNCKERLSTLSPVTLVRSKSILKQRQRGGSVNGHKNDEGGRSCRNKVTFGSKSVPIAEVIKVKSYREDVMKVKKEYEKQRIENQQQQAVCSECLLF